MIIIIIMIMLCVVNRAGGKSGVLGVQIPNSIDWEGARAGAGGGAVPTRYGWTNNLIINKKKEVRNVSWNQRPLPSKEGGGRETNLKRRMAMGGR